MSKNPFTDRPEASMHLELLKIGQRVLIVEKHKQGVKTKEELTDGYIQGFLTSKPFHPQGIKVSIIRKSFLDGKTVDDETLSKTIGTMAGDLDINKYAIGRVQYIVETDNDIQTGDIVQITKSTKIIRESDLMEGVVMNVIKFELIEGEQKTMVELCDGYIGWVQKVISKV